MTYSCIKIQLARFLLRGRTRARFIYKKGGFLNTVFIYIRLIINALGGYFSPVFCYLVLIRCGGPIGLKMRPPASVSPPPVRIRRTAQIAFPRSPSSDTQGHPPRLMRRADRKFPVLLSHGIGSRA